MNIIKCIREKIEASHGFDGTLYSLILFGSYVRGDFIPGTSDIDFFAVLERDNRIVISEIKDILKECCGKIGAVEIDLAWELKENMKDPLNRGYPFKFLTIYQEDFLKHHVLIYGEELEMRRYDARSLIPFRCAFIMESVHNSRNNKMLHILAGEVCRLMAILNGAKSLRKEDVLETLQKIGDEQAISIYSSYLQGRKMDFMESELMDFIKSRCERIARA